VQGHLAANARVIYFKQGPSANGGSSLATKVDNLRKKVQILTVDVTNVVPR
jgi:hypothetical protein